MPWPAFSRLLLFDLRGLGLSDPLGPNEQLTLERSPVDLLAVFDEAGCERAALVANNMSGFSRGRLGPVGGKLCECCVLRGR